MLVNDLKNHVLCSQCKKFGYELGPYQCKKGHMICPQCQPRTNVCLQCFVIVDVNDPIQCHSSVDFLRDKVPVPCIYKLHGCTVKKERAEIREHLIMCPFGVHVNDGGNRRNVVVEGTGTAEAGAIVGGAESLGQLREKTSGANDNGNGGEAVNNAHMDSRNEGKFRGTKGFVSVKTSNKKRDNDKVVLAKETVSSLRLDGENIATLMEDADLRGLVQRKSVRHRRKPQKYSPSRIRAAFAPEDARMKEENLGSLVPRKNSRKRRQPQKYSPSRFTAIVKITKERKA